MPKCRFYNKDFCRCSVLSDTKCSEKCKFRKTDEEFYEGIKHSEEILKSKGLVACTVRSPEGGEIMTTRKVR